MVANIATLDIERERVIPWTEIANLSFVRRAFGRKPDRRTVQRWMNRGVRGIRLESANVGGRKVTTIEALKRWCAATNYASLTSPQVAPVSPAARARANAEADRLCREAGF